MHKALLLCIAINIITKYILPFNMSLSVWGILSLKPITIPHNRYPINDMSWYLYSICEVTVPQVFRSQCAPVLHTRKSSPLKGNSYTQSQRWSQYFIPYKVITCLTIISQTFFFLWDQTFYHQTHFYRYRGQITRTHNFNWGKSHIMWT